jgi:hypothetical protein
MYEPYAYTNKKTNQGKFSYPGNVNGKLWNKEALKDYLHAVIDFQKKFNIPSSQVLIGEFGGHRTTSGLDMYFKDLIEIFQANRWHFAFYAFREDTWDGMDYELGSNKLPWRYWQAIEKGEQPKLKRSSHNTVFKVITDSLHK